MPQIETLGISGAHGVQPLGLIVNPESSQTDEAKAGVLGRMVRRGAGGMRDAGTELSALDMIEAPSCQPSPEQAYATVNSLLNTLGQGATTSGQGGGLSGFLPDANFAGGSPEAMRFAIGNLCTQSLLANIDTDSKTLKEISADKVNEIKAEAEKLEQQYTEQTKAHRFSLISEIVNLVMSAVKFVMDAVEGVGEVIAGDPQGLATLADAALDTAMIGLQIAAMAVHDPTKQAKIEKAEDGIMGAQVLLGLIGGAVSQLISYKAGAAAVRVGESIGASAGEDVAALAETGSAGASALGEGAATADVLANVGSDLDNEAQIGEQVEAFATTDANGSAVESADSASQTDEAAGEDSSDARTRRTEKAAKKPAAPKEGDFALDEDAGKFNSIVDKVVAAAKNESGNVTGAATKAFEEEAVRELITSLLDDALKDGLSDDTLKEVQETFVSRMQQSISEARNSGAIGVGKAGSKVIMSADGVFSGSSDIVKAKQTNQVNLDSLAAQRQQVALKLASTISNMMIQSLQTNLKYYRQNMQRMSDMTVSEFNLSNTIASNI